MQIFDNPYNLSNFHHQEFLIEAQNGSVCRKLLPRQLRTLCWSCQTILQVFCANHWWLNKRIMTIVIIVCDHDKDDPDPEIDDNFVPRERRREVNNYVWAKKKKVTLALSLIVICDRNKLQDIKTRCNEIKIFYSYFYAL